MDKQEIIEGNRLIAFWMGAEIGNPVGDKEVLVNIPDFYSDRTSSTWPTEDLRYHKRWDWLMPVVESIPSLNPDNGKIHFEYEISRCHCKIWSSRQNQWKNNLDTTIGATWKTVVEFIKWYSQKQ